MTEKINKILNPFYEIMPLKGIDMYETITSYFDFDLPEDPLCKQSYLDDIHKIEEMREYRDSFRPGIYKLCINGEEYEISYEIKPIFYKYLEYRCKGHKWFKANKLCMTHCFNEGKYIDDLLLYKNSYWLGLTTNHTPNSCQKFAQIDQDIYNPLVYIPKICLALLDVPKLVASTNLPEHIQKQISKFMIHKSTLYKFAKRYWECLISIMMHFNCDGNAYGEEIYSGGTKCPLDINYILSSYGMNFTAFYMYHYCNIYISENIKSRITEIAGHSCCSDIINPEYIKDKPVYDIKYIEDQYQNSTIPWRKFKNMLIPFRIDDASYNDPRND